MFVTAGSTIAGPGFSVNVSLPSTTNQIRPPAIRGIVTLAVEPGAPSGIATSAPSGDCGCEGDCGRYTVLPSDWRKMGALLLFRSRPVM